MKGTWRTDALFASVLACAGAIFPAANLKAAEWQIETVDISGAAQFTTMQVDKSGNVHLAYVPDVDGHPLKYAYWDHASKRWFTMTVTNIASFATLVLDSHQRPHIAFADHGSGRGARLRHAYWDGTKWNIAPINVQPGTVVAYYTSIGLDANDNPFFSFYDYADRNETFRLRLRAVSWVSDHWEARTVDAQGGSGKFNSLAVDSSGNPHIAYANVKYETSGLRFADWNGETWKTAILEGAAGPTPVYSVAMVMDKNDNPHVTYSLVQTGVVKYATRVDGKWTLQPVDTIKAVAYPDRNGIVLDGNGEPYISYYDSKVGVLKIAHRDHGKWMAEVLDGDFSGFTSSLAISGDTLWVAYANETNNALRVAHRPLEQPRPTDSPVTQSKVVAK
jgi:hypothetical protein